MSYFKTKPIRLKGAKLSSLIHKVLERDDFTCQGESIHGVKCPGGFTMDYPHHIVFKSQGGEDTMENLVLLCRHCHGKCHGINVVR